MAPATETKPLRVLIVDDEALIRASIRNGLAAREDIVVMGECESGAEAMYAIRQLGPDLVLLDVQMHDGTGLEVRGTGAHAPPEARQPRSRMNTIAAR